MFSVIVEFIAKTRAFFSSGSCDSAVVKVVVRILCMPCVVSSSLSLFAFSSFYCRKRCK